MEFHPHPDVVVHHADALDVLSRFPDRSVHAVVTDPPYGVGFMGKKWDSMAGFRHSLDANSAGHAPPGDRIGDVYQAWCQKWASECLRLLRPGGHLLAFGGPRTYHRLATGIESAGFEIRDVVHWIYGNGFPKSYDVAKAIDRQRDDRAGIVRVTAWFAEQCQQAGVTQAMIDAHMGTNGMARHWTSSTNQPSVPTWPQWLALRALVGFGTEMDAEVARLNERKGSAGDTWSQREVVGTEYRQKAPSGIVDVGQGPRTRITRTLTAPASNEAKRWQGWGTALKPAYEPIMIARKPLNGTVATTVQQWDTGAINVDGCRVGGQDGRWPSNVLLEEEAADELDQAGRGCVSRYFPVFRYQPKAPPGERPEVDGIKHPTVKPLELMRWLARLVTPPRGVVMDPFAGSGTSLRAAVDEGFGAVGVEREASYLPLIRARFLEGEGAG